MRLGLMLVVALGAVGCGGGGGGSESAADSVTETGGGTRADGPSTSAATLDDATGGEATVTTSLPPSSTGSGPMTDSASTSGDASGSDGASSTGALPQGQWSITQITYDGPSGTQMVDPDDCTFCDATLNGPTLLVRFQQAEGWTVWSIDIPIDSMVGAQPITADYSGAYVAINEQNPDLPAGYTGFYAPTTASGTLTLTQADISEGGVVAGTLTAHLSLTDVTADLEADFYAEIP